MSQKKINYSPSPEMRPLAVRYHSNGSGRDSYIGTTNGGLCNAYSFTDYKTSFKNSLRQPTE